MPEPRRRVGGFSACARRLAIALPVLSVAIAGTALAARRAKSPDVHRPEADCRVCHTADAATLRGDGEAARAALVPDLEARCADCHGDEGVSHPTGGRPQRPVPATLPLADGRITCATCHFMHGESDAFGDFVRIDNRRGGLCLTCHELSELQ